MMTAMPGEKIIRKAGYIGAKIEKTKISVLDHHRKSKVCKKFRIPNIQAQTQDTATVDR